MFNQQWFMEERDREGNMGNLQGLLGNYKAEKRKFPERSLDP